VRGREGKGKPGGRWGDVMGVAAPRRLMRREGRESDTIVTREVEEEEGRQGERR
jgi:hypothetical protein